MSFSGRGQSLRLSVISGGKATVIMAVGLHLLACEVINRGELRSCAQVAAVWGGGRIGDG